MRRLAKRIKRTLQGFALAELLIVISIVSVLFVGFATVGKSQIDKGHDARRKSDLHRFKLALEEYYDDNGCYPTIDEWSCASCESTSALSPYMKSFSCDPVTKKKYVYQTTDKEGNPCDGTCGECKGYRLLALLASKDDDDITEVGCEATWGCGLKTADEAVPNWGIAMGNKVSVPGFVPGLEGTNSFISYDPPICGALPSPIPTASVCIAAKSPNPGTNIDYWSAPGSSSGIHRDFERLTHALEWYKVERGQYPSCGCAGSWQNASTCLDDSLNKYMKEPERLRSSYDYLQTGGEYCLAAPYNGFMAPVNYACPTGHSNPSIGITMKSPLSPLPKMPYSNIWPVLPESQASARDALRKQDVAIIAHALSSYKDDHGQYPPVPMPYDQFVNIENFSSYLVPSYLPSLPRDPDGQHRYDVSLWDGGPGTYRNACVMSYMDKASNCANTCGTPTVYWYYDFCYGAPAQ